MTTSKPAQTDMLTVGEAARVVGVSTDTIRRWDAKGTLPSHRTPTGHRRFRRADVEAALTAPAEVAS